jgi:L-2-hydroxyglutarate oxidase LhgO
MIGSQRLRALEPHAAGIQALHVASTGITDYGSVTRKYADLVQGAGGVIATGTRVLALSRRDGQVIAETNRGEYRARQMINCAGLYSDHVSRMAGTETDVRIVPFRGEYYELAPHKHGLVRGLIYPVPDPVLPFLGVHFTRRVNGSVEAGPNAVLALRREGYRSTDIRLGELLETLAWPGFRRMAWRQWRSAVGEYYRSFRKSAFVQALQKLVPEIREPDLTPGGAGVRAQAVDREGNLVDDFRLACSPGMVHVLNVPSPAATASLVIAREIVNLAERNGC